MENKELEDLYRQCYKPLLLYAFTLTGSREDAEDLVANTFVKALTTFQSGNVRAWMYTVMRHEFFDLQKKRKRMADAPLEEVPDGEDLLEALVEKEQRRWLYRQIGTLPPRERELMLLTIQMGCRDDEIAQILGLTAAHVRVLRSRAKKKLLEQSKEEQP